MAISMKALVTCIVFVVGWTANALPPVRPALPAVAHADTEVTTNVPFAAWQKRKIVELWNYGNRQWEIGIGCGIKCREDI